MKTTKRVASLALCASALKLLTSLLLALMIAVAARAQEPETRAAIAVNRGATTVGQQTGQHAQPAPAAEDRAAGVSSTYGSIRGRVMGDDGRPLGNVTVFARSVNRLAPVSPQSSQTDADGKFELANLTPGAYTVDVHAPGYIMLRDEMEANGRNGRSFHRLGDNINIRMTKGGVITGTVTGATEQPVVAVQVRIIRVRDALGRPIRAPEFMRNIVTDDRGVYRSWGLEPGSYLVSAGGAGTFYDIPMPFDEDTPTYYPSATRDGATEVVVRYGDEIRSIDIRYRGERGRRVSGTISGATQSKDLFNDGVYVVLLHAASGTVEGGASLSPGEGNSFTINSVPDGEYDVMAQRGWGNDSAASPARRITVKGADVTGLKLVLAPLGTITGRVVIETPAAPPPACEERAKRSAPRPPALEETVISARLDEKSTVRPRLPWFASPESSPKSSGEFAFGSLLPGRYRLDTQLPNDRWYIRAITMSNTSVTTPVKAGVESRPAGPAKSNNATTSPTAVPSRHASSTGGALEADGSVLIEPGTQVTGVTIALASGAAKLTGRIVADVEGASLPPRLRLYLVPREAERADDLLRFAEVAVGSDGMFMLTNLAPGRYWLIARPAPDADAFDLAPRPLAWNREARAALRRDAETARQEIELQPCQQLIGVTVHSVPDAPLNK